MTWPPNPGSRGRVSGESWCSAALDLPSAEFRPNKPPGTGFVTRHGFAVARALVKGLKVFSLTKELESRPGDKRKRKDSPTTAVCCKDGGPFARDPAVTAGAVAFATLSPLFKK